MENKPISWDEYWESIKDEYCKSESEDDSIDENEDVHYMKPNITLSFTIEDIMGLPQR